MPSRTLKAKHHFFVDVDMKDVLVPVDDADLRPGTGTKVVVTLGPSCHEVDVLVDLLHAGMTCARIDLTWGSPAYHQVSLTNLEEAMQSTGRLCSVWLDTTGREITVRRRAQPADDGWLQHETPIHIEAGQSVRLTVGNEEASASVLPITYPGFAETLYLGQTVVVARYLSTGAEGGTLALEVTGKEGEDVMALALNDASLEGLLTVMAAHAADAPDTAFDMAIPVMTEHDASCIREFGKTHEIDYVSLSYCSSEADVAECRAFLDAVGMLQTKVIAKIERKPGVRNFDAICMAADGVLLSRGNLGLDYDAELMALLQKRLVGRCNLLGKPVIVTRFVDTMVSTPRPTRAEATDVANAVLDGVDGVLLGAETLRGAYPLLTVQTVIRLCRAAELRFDYRAHHELMVNESYEEELSLARGRDSEVDFMGSMAGDDASSTTSLLRLAELPGGGRRSRGLGSLAPALPSSLTLATGAPVGLSTSATLHTSGLPPLHPDADGAGSGGSGPGTWAGPAPATHTTSSFGSLAPLPRGAQRNVQRAATAVAAAAYMHKLDSVASSATRTAEKIAAGLIIVVSASGRTTSLVAKFRPPMPIMAVVVPTLKSNSLSWRLEGKYLARQCLIMRGVYPMLAAPMSSGSDDLLSEAIGVAVEQGLCKALDYVVCITAERGALVVKVVQVDEEGQGMLCLGMNVGPLAPEMGLASFNATALASPVLAKGPASPFAGAGASPFGGVGADMVGSPMDLRARVGHQSPRSPGGRRGGSSAGLLGAMTDADAIGNFARVQAAEGASGFRLPTLSEL